MLDKVLAVALGGALGALMRFALQNWSFGRWGVLFPYGTLLVNLTGALLIGFLMTVLLNHVHVAPAWRLFLVTGILGGYTTFSAFAWETFTLTQGGHYGLALLYAGVSFFGGVGAVVFGAWLGRLA